MIHRGAYPSPAGGMFAGHARLPQMPDMAANRELLGELNATEPVVRASDTGRHTFTGGLVDVQAFTTPSGVNSPDSLAVLPITAYNARRALARTRGIPGA